MKVYQKVRQYIDDHHLKQISVACKAGIPRTKLSAMLNGKRTMYADDLRSICYALNVSANTFIDTTEYNETRENNRGTP